MRAVELALFAFLSFMAGPVFATVVIPVETLDIFLLSLGIIAVVTASVPFVRILRNKRDHSVQNAHAGQSNPAISTERNAAGIEKDQGVRGRLQVLNILTFAATETANSAAVATTHAAIASKRAAAAAKEAASMSMENVAEAAAAAAVEAACAARKSEAAAKAAMKAVAAAVEYQAEISLLLAETQAAAALKQASESAAEAVRMAHAASASLGTDSTSQLRPSL